MYPAFIIFFMVTLIVVNLIKIVIGIDSSQSIFAIVMGILAIISVAHFND